MFNKKNKMLLFPNSKINIGLNIVKKRKDGFHDLETIFYPLDLTDILEFTTSESRTELTQTGIKLDSDPENNLVLKAYNLLNKNYDLPVLNIHLHKIIPSGAGLGGGSSDAAYMLKALNKFFNLGISKIDLLKFAGEIGSDCPFFLLNKPILAEGIGNIFKDLSLDLSNYYILLIKPEIHISTKEAFSGIKPVFPKESLRDIIQKPISHWKKYVKNDFEPGIFNLYPEIESIKNKLYEQGAGYAQMSGSGSSLFGIFDFKPEIPKEFEKYFTYIQKPLAID